MDIPSVNQVTGRGALGGSDAGRTESTDREIVIRLDDNAPLHGVIEDHAGTQIFSGWLELLTYLDVSVNAGRSATSGGPREG